MRLVHLLGCAILTTALAAQEPPPANFQKICGTCHEIKQVTARRQTKSAWQGVVEDMVARGAEGSEEDMAAIVQYLAANFGRLNVNTATAEQIQKTLGFTDVEAKAIVAYRQQNGKIENYEALQKVPGIDAEKLRQKRGWISYTD